MIYFLRAGDSPLVKVGYAGDVAARARQLQTGCPETLHLEGTIPGSVLDEKRLHRALDNRRERGEWFALSAYEVAALADLPADPPPRPVPPPSADDIARLREAAFVDRIVALFAGEPAPNIWAMRARVYEAMDEHSVCAEKWRADRDARDAAESHRRETDRWERCRDEWAARKVARKVAGDD